MTPESLGVQTVHVTGFSWSTVGIAILNLLVGGALVSWIKSRPKLKELEQNAEAKLIDALSSRVDKLEKALIDQRDHYERKLDGLASNYEADKRVSRHELNNVKMRFKALVMLLKRLPEPPAMLIAILADIETMEAEQLRAEALEKGAQSARLRGDAGEPIAP